MGSLTATDATLIGSWMYDNVVTTYLVISLVSRAVRYPEKCVMMCRLLADYNDRSFCVAVMISMSKKYCTTWWGGQATGHE